MSTNLNDLPIEDLSPAEAPVSTPAVEEPVVPPVVEAPKSDPVVQDKQPQQIPNETVPRWRLNEEIEKRRALEQRLQSVPQQPQAPAAPSAPKEEDFADFASYNAAVVAHTVQQELQKERQRQSQHEQNSQFYDRVKKADSTWEEKMYAESAKDPGFIEAIQNSPALRPELQLMLKESDDPIGLAKHLAANPGQIIAMNNMPFEKAIRELTKAELSLTTAKAGPSKIPAKQAPDLDPVTGGITPPQKNA